MSRYLRLLFTLLTIAAAASCNAVEYSVDASFKPAQGWILVTSGSVSDVEAAIKDYDDLYREERPRIFRVELHPQSNGAVAIVFPDGSPAYDLTNLTDWLSYIDGVAATASWITAPGNGIRYYLEPETSNPSGDTLIGASELGQPVRVSLPETGISEVSSTHHYRAEPEIEVAPRPVTIEVTLDTNTAFGNPQFVIDSPKDHDWRW